MRLGCIWGLLLAVTLSASGVHAQEPDPEAEFGGDPTELSSDETCPLVDSELALRDGALQGRDALLLSLPNADPASPPPIPVITDLDMPSPPVLSFTFTPRLAASSDTLLRWVIEVEVAGLVGEVDEDRFLAIEAGGQSFTCRYHLTNRTDTAFAWTVEGPGAEFTLAPGQPIEIGIAVQGRPANNVRLRLARFIEDSTKSLVDGGWLLCPTPAEVCASDATVSLPANSATRLWLRSAGALVGKYVGSVTIAAAEDPEGETVPLTLYGSSLWRQIAGVLVILAGVALAWLASTWSQNAINRRRLLRPVVALADRSAVLARRLDELKPPANAKLVETRRQFEALSAAAMVGALDKEGMIPGAVPLPGPADETQLDAYKVYLADRTKRFQILEMVIRDGFEQIPVLLGAKPSKTKLEDAATAVASLDLLSGRPLELDAVSAEIATILAPLRPASQSQGDDIGATVPTSDQLTLELSRLSWLVWAVFGLLATALGAATLVFANPGFGLPMDFLFCLFWGFGLPTSTQTLMTASVASAGTPLGITVPRSDGG